MFKTLGIFRLASNSNILANGDRSLIVGVYVDDLVILSRARADRLRLISELETICELKLKFSEDISDCLGLRITTGPNYIVTHQQDKIEKLAKKLGIESNNSQEVPIRTDKLLEDYEEEKTIDDLILYMSIIGELLYISRMTRPDIQVAVNQLARFNTKAKKQHLTFAKQVVQFLFNTRMQRLVYAQFYTHPADKTQILAFSDSDFANDVRDRKSFSGNAIYLDSMLVSWTSVKQTIVAQSTNEAEIIAANEALREALYIRNIVSELSCSSTELKLLTDNKGVIKFAIRGVGQRTKHLDLRLKLLYDLYSKKEIKISFVNSEFNVADLFTKFLNRTIFKRLSLRLNLLKKGAVSVA